MNDIVTNLNLIQQRIRAAEKRYHRPPDSVSLLTVSKSQPLSAIAKIIKTGQKDIGENYLQEAIPKISAFVHEALVWHFIGTLQAKKLPIIAKHFSWVHSVTRAKEALILSQHRPSHLPPLNVCLQVKLESRATNQEGLIFSELNTLMNLIGELPGLQARGLMLLPPQCTDFTEQRSYFKKARLLLAQLQIAGYLLDTLSMGMTHDLEAAIAEGATVVRIGQGIFGPREAR